MSFHMHLNHGDALPDPMRGVAFTSLFFALE